VRRARIACWFEGVDEKSRRSAWLEDVRHAGRSRLYAILATAQLTQHRGLHLRAMERELLAPLPRVGSCASRFPQHRAAAR